MEAGFDRYEDAYEELVQRSIGWSGVDHGFFVEAKARHLLRLVRRHLGDPARMRALDVGCGIGVMHRYLRGLGALRGSDVSPASVERARRDNPGVEYAVGDAAALPYEDAAFDVSFASGLLHHLPPEKRDAALRELGRVVRPGGLVVPFEHNPLNPLTRLAVARCEFDEDAVLLGPRELRARFLRVGLRPVDERYLLFFPWRGAALRRAEDALRRLPLGAQYYVAARKTGSSCNL
jgi:SAM-dependent methyltransferase